MKSTKTKIVTAKGHKMTPHMHRTLGQIPKGANMNSRQGYGSKGSYRGDYSMTHKKSK